MNVSSHSIAEPLRLAPATIRSLTTIVMLCVVLLAYPVDLVPEMPRAMKYLGLPLLGMGGVLCADRLGLRLIASSWRENLVIPLLASLAVGLPILALDPQSLGRTDYSGLLYYPAKATTEEVIYRLGATSCIAFLLTLAVRSRLPAFVCVMGAALVAQSINVGLHTPDASQHLIYIGLRYLLPGLVWTWLYLRYGFLAAIVGHAGTHLWLDPVLGYLPA